MTVSRSLVSAFLAAAVLVGTGCGAPEQHVSIDFGLYPEEFVGETVFIDDQAVGRLDRIGQATRMAFPVGLGEHEVRISHPRLRTSATLVHVQTRGEKVRLVADIVENFENGRLVPTVVLE